MRTIVILFFVLSMVILITGVASAVNPANWSANLATEGEDVFWTSPTPVDPSWEVYAWTLEVTRVEVFTALGGTDVTGQLGETSDAGVSGALPIHLLDETMDNPTSGSSARVRVEIDASGFGQASMTDVTLGTFLFLPIHRAKFDTTVTIDGFPAPPGDFNIDGLVNDIDLGNWQGGYGMLGGALKSDGDADGDGNVTGSDMLIWQQNHGTDLTPTAAVAATAAIPEPATSLLLCVGAALLAMPRRRRVSNFEQAITISHRFT